MKFIKEDAIEEHVITLFTSKGYEYLSQDEALLLRNHKTNYVLLDDIIKEYLVLNYPKISKDIINQIILKLRDLSESSVMVSNKAFLKVLSEGIKIQNQKTKETETYRIINEKKINNNLFHVTNQFVCDSIEKGKKRVPDVVVFINGIPFSVFELKAPEAMEQNLEAAYNQVKHYERNLPSLFTYNSFNVISDMTTTLFGTLTSSFAWYMNWREIKKVDMESLDTLIESLFKKTTLIDIIMNYSFFTNEKKYKKVMALPHQYYGTKKALKSIEESKDGKGGIFWHTQGSGKSFSMLFLIRNFSKIKRGTTFIIVTDRVDLDEQMTNNCYNAKHYLNQKIHNINSIKNLKDSLEGINQDGIYLTTVQKFVKEVGVLSKREDIVVIVDEAHRSHTNLEGKWFFDEEQTNVERFGNARYLRDAFPKATFIGFTGTPIENEDKSTSEIFGKVISKYLLSDAQKDNVIVPITYESRRPDLHFDEKKMEELNQAHKDSFKEIKDKTYLPSEVQKKMNKSLQKIENIIGDPERIKGVVKDIIHNYKERKNFVAGKALIVTITRKVAFKYYKEIIKQAPELKKNIKIIMTSSLKDKKEWLDVLGTKEDRKKWAIDFKDPNSNFKIAIVVDMWSTGFDVPCLDTLYLDKPLKKHNLMQTVARINRVYVDKENSINKTSAQIIDYIGIYRYLVEALRIYSSDIKKSIVFKDVQKLIPGYMKFIDSIYELFFSEIEIPFQEMITNKGAVRIKAVKSAINEIIKNNEQANFVTNTKDLRGIFTQSASKLTELQKIKMHFLIVVRSETIKIELGKVDLTTINKDLKKILDEAIEHNNFTVVNRNKGKEIKIQDIIESILKRSEGGENKDLEIHLKAKQLEKAIFLTRRINKVRSEEIGLKLKNLLEKYKSNFITQEELERDMELLGEEILKGTSKPGWKAKYSDEEISFYSIISDKKYTQNKVDEEKIKEIFKDLLDILNNQSNINPGWLDYEAARAEVRSKIIKLLVKHNYPPEGRNVKPGEVVEQVLLQKRGENYEW